MNGYVGWKKSTSFLMQFDACARYPHPFQPRPHPLLIPGPEGPVSDTPVHNPIII